ncbi:hypothetical protein PUR28_01250 [Streptomyces sp. BE308]|uniref:hypothetical protein n=1 Tax=Streptomyces sp. BE308 TaxID=3002529 RepID=UPI002E763E5A|nr:hypothetical protein [Streptomyces sp. BE308]MEE1789417.1 hypothetical protein [Streptomyces sp. BE308]
MAGGHRRHTETCQELGVLAWEVDHFTMHLLGSGRDSHPDNLITAAPGPDGDVESIPASRIQDQWTWHWKAVNIIHDAFSCEPGVSVTAFQLKGVGGYHDNDPVGKNNGSIDRMYCSDNTTRVESDWFHLLGTDRHGWHLVRGWMANDQFFAEDSVTTDHDGQLRCTETSPSNISFLGAKK